jgi:capsular polysaccharide biosynthesis protein
MSGTQIEDVLASKAGRIHPRVGAFAAVRRHPVIALIPVVALTALGVFAGLARTPTYSATAKLSVGRLNIAAPGALAGFQSAVSSLADAYSRSVSADGVVDPVSKKLRVAPRDVRDRLSATPIPGTPVFRVEAEGPTAAEAIRTANAASVSLITYVDRLNRANPDAARLFGDLQKAALANSRAASAARRARRSYEAQPTASTRQGLERAVGQAAAAKVRLDALEQTYVTSQQGAGATSIVQILARASDASSDRIPFLEVSVFAGLIAGIALGVTLATLRANRLVRRYLS